MGREQNVARLLQDKAEQVSTAASLIASKTKDWQMIKRYISNRVDEIKLTPTQQEKLKRYEYIYNQLVSSRYTEHEVINQITKLFNIQLPQAYEDMNCARELWTSTLNINKRFELKMELESAKDCKRKCIEVGDFKNASAYSKIIALLLREIEDEQETPGDLFDGIHIEATFNPALLGAPPITKKDMTDLLATINAKRNKKINLDFIDELEYEDA